MTTPSNTLTLGTCSLCGGAVTVPAIVGSVVPPTPECSQCGAVVKASPPRGPTTPMQPRRATAVAAIADAAGTPLVRVRDELHPDGFGGTDEGSQYDLKPLPEMLAHCCTRTVR